MILMEFLFALTVPSAPNPQNNARTWSSGFSTKARIKRHAGKCHIVVDPDGEMVFWLGFLQFVKYRLAHRRSELL